MLRLEGKVVASTIETHLKTEVATFTKKLGRKPKLAVILVGDDPASHVYVKNKELGCERVGLLSERLDLPADVSEAKLLKQIQDFNHDPTVDAILVQMPLPKHISTEKVLDTVSPLKDVDGLTPENLGRLWAGRTRVAPCTPSGVIEILKHYQIPMAGAHAVVVGRSNIVGKPMSQLLLNEQATVSIGHSKTRDLASLTRLGDIVVVAAGQPHLLGKDAFKKDAVVIDVGIHRQSNGKLCGDVRYDELQGHVKAATPVPGGVGPMTIVMLLKNTLELAKARSLDSKN